jgi:type II secretion system protein I
VTFRFDRRRRTGYSLVELMAAFTIFSIGVLGTMELFSVCLQSTSASLGYTNAVFLAQQVMEETIAEGYLSADTNTGEYQISNRSYTWTCEVEDTDDLSLMQVRVVVEWTERMSQKEYEITTLVAERDEW